jgi:PAS domain S-box-containing protein
VHIADPPAQHHERLQVELLADSLGDGLLWVDDEGVIVDASGRYAAMVGYTRDELIGSFPPHPDAVASERAELVEVAAATIAGHARRVELTITGRDGEPMAIIAAGSQTRGRNGLQALIGVRDNADRLRADEARAAAELRLQGVIEATDQAVWVGDIDGATQWANSELATLLGQDAHALTGHPFEQFMPLALRGQARSALNAVRLDGASRRLHTVLSSADGTDRPVKLRLHPVSRPSGEIGCVVATIAEASVLNAAEGSRVVVDPADMIDGAVIGLDSEGRIRHWNEGARRLLGYAAAETVGRNAFALLRPGAAPDDEAARLRALHRSGAWQGEVTLQRRDGTPVTVYTRSVKVEEGGTSFATVDVSVDMTEWKEAQSRNEEARSYLGAIANSMADGMYAVTSDGRLAFMNPAAERMLGWTTAELKGRVMHSVIHYQHADGSGFPAHDCPAGAALRDGKIVKVDDDVFTRRDGTLMPVAYTASPIKHASSTAGSVLVFTDISERKEEAARLELQLAELTWVERLQEALDADRVMLYAQPVTGVSSGVVEQYKLHVRILIDGELVPPEDWMPFVESHSIVMEIDRWVLRRVCKLAADGAVVKYALSPRATADPLVRSEFKKMLQESGADPANVMFDMTECAVLADPEAATRFATIMNGVGCKIGLGNFGMGFGGLTFLDQMPVEYLKVNTELVRDLVGNDSNQYVIGATVGLARRFGLRTTADGVDHPATLEVLRDLGVDHARGLALGAPGPAREVIGRARS